MRHSLAGSPDKARPSAALDPTQDEPDVRYERLDKLGEGTYGIVYKSRDRETNEVSILKKSNRICCSEAECEFRLWRSKR